MSTTLFLKELKGSLFSSGVIAAVLALYIVCIVYMFDPEIAESLNLIIATMPELCAAFGMANAPDTLLGFLLNYLYGFVFTWAPLLMIMILVNRMVVRPIDRGSMAYLLASPTSRLPLALTFALTLATMLAALMAVIVALQVACAEAFFPGDLDAEGLLLASAGLYCLWLFLGGLCFLSACAFKDARLALWVGGGLCLALFLVQMVAGVGEGIEVLQTFNPVELYDPYALAAGEDDAVGNSGILGVSGIALMAAGTAIFCRRDMNV